MRRPKTSGLTTLYVVLAFLAATVAEAGQALIKPEAVPAYQPKFYPFEGGEKAVYRASWNGMFSVATAEIHTVPTVVGGKKVYQVRVEAKTSKALDLIWKMRDTISSTFDATALAPSSFTFNQKENSKVIDTDARYDSSTKRWAVHRQQVGKRAKIYEFDSQNTLDPITTVYLARSVDFNVGDRLFFNIFGGRYRYLLELHVQRKEPVELESGKVIDAFKIIPQVQNTTKSGYAGRLNEATIWISADERRLPIKLSSKIIFGSIYLEIVQDKQGVQSTAGEAHRHDS